MPTSVSRRVRRSALIASVGAALACAPAQAAEACAGADHVPSPTVSAADVRALACVVNRERQRRGRSPLRRVRALDRAAALHAADMVARDYFDHRSPGGSLPADRAREAGYASGARAWQVGETIAWAAGSSATPERIVALWLHSPPHRAILLDRGVTDTGVGIAAGTPGAGAGGATYTLLVGSRR